ncbi:MAG: hypothetical protein AAF431_06985 [Pseudomonadota bacterium]
MNSRILRMHLLLLCLFSISTITHSNDEKASDTKAQSLDWSKIVGPGYAEKSDCAVNISTYLKLDNPALPVPPSASAGADNKACIWDIFAWNSFAALNWPSNTALGKRGLPLADQSFLGNSTYKDAGNEVVWEAFKEKRELFQDDYSRNWNDIENGEEVKRFKTPDNIWSKYEGYCSAEDLAKAGTASSGPFAANKFHNQLDETAEVQSQALESTDVLCMGHGGAPCDINNESVVGPRVWAGDASTGRPIYYEVKVNYDFFDYVVNPPSDMALPTANANLIDDEVSATNAMLNNIRLPWRSAASSGNTSNQNAVFGYGDGSCDATKGEAESGVSNAYVPCRTGAVHMKAAWIQLTDTELATNPIRYHTTTALYYETPPKETGKLCIAVDTFGLVGLHAIQRVKTSGIANPAGAFVFATMEHRSVLDSSYAYPQKYTYVNLLTNPLFGPPTAGDPYPTLDNAITVSRMIPTAGDKSAQTTCGLSAEQTCQVNAAALKKLSSANSIWANYRLVGTQFAPNDCAFTEGDSDYEEKQLALCRYKTLSALGQPHFLANTLIETNQGLQHFLGLPPAQSRLQPNKWCAPDASNSDYCDLQAARLVGPNMDNGGLNFDRGADNVVYSGGQNNMGGCQGCHGIAQQNGYSFSFVLLDGVNGAKADTEDEGSIPATAIAQSVPVYLQLTNDTNKYISIGSAYKGDNKYYNLTTSDLGGAAQWRLQPFTGDSENKSVPNFGGNILVTDVGGRGSMQLGQTGGGFNGPVVGDKNSALVGPINTGSTSRAAQQQYVFLVKTDRSTDAADAYALVSTATTTGVSGVADAHYLLTAGSSVSAQPPGALPKKTSPATPASGEILKQMFNIVLVPPPTADGE